MKNSDWFQDLFYTHYAVLCKQAYRYVPDKLLCEDIVQECFLTLWEQEKNTRKILNIPAYLSVAVKNKCISFLRKQQYEVSIDDEIVQAEVSEMTEIADNPKPDAETLIRDVLDLLPKKCRMIFEKSRIEKKTYQQIADELNISLKTVENQMGKSLKIIREYVHEHPEFFVFGFAMLVKWIGI